MQCSGCIVPSAYPYSYLQLAVTTVLLRYYETYKVGQSYLDVYPSGSV